MLSQSVLTFPAPRARRLLRIAILCGALLYCLAPRAEVLVAAASSIREPLDRIAGAFERDYGGSVKISYGASGNLAHQILRGAPYQLFLSANLGYPQRIWQAGKGKRQPRIYARGSLHLYANQRSRCDLEAGLAGLVTQIEAGRIQRIAIAKPSLAPYGLATRQALENAGLWQRLSAHLAIGNNVAQAAQFGFSGAADCAFISTSLARVPALAGNGRSIAVPAELYEPVRHAMILLARADKDAQDFYRFLSSDSAQAVFVAAGFGAAGD